jgi:hypothetical protein
MPVDVIYPRSEDKEILIRSSCIARVISRNAPPDSCAVKVVLHIVTVNVACKRMQHASSTGVTNHVGYKSPGLDKEASHCTP